MDWALSSDAIVSPASDVRRADALSDTLLLACASIMSKTSLTGTGGSRYSRIISAVSLCFAFSAQSAGLSVSPMVRASLDAPARNSRAAVSLARAWPAKCRGVQPLFAALVTTAPSASSSRWQTPPSRSRRIASQSCEKIGPKNF